MAGSAATLPTGTVGLSRESAIAMVTTDNEPRLNAVSSAAWRRDAEVFGAPDCDAAVRCIVQRGAGDRGVASAGDFRHSVRALPAQSKPDFVGR